MQMHDGFLRSSNKWNLVAIRHLVRCVWPSIFSMGCFRSMKANIMKFLIPYSNSSKSLAVTLLVFLAIIASTASSIVAQKAAPQANPNLDQCANGAAPSPRLPCAGTNWLSGDLTPSIAQFNEGESVPYRLVYSGVSGTNSSITIEWDTTKSGRHAFDYLTTYNRTEVVGNDPCSGVAGCSLATNSTIPIPTDPDVTAGFDHIAGNSDDIAQIPGLFTMFGGTITSVSAYNLTGSYAVDSTRSITVNFTFGPTGTVVLAWSGHIGRRAEWGLDSTVLTIQGFPYHTRVNGQDRSVDVNTIVFPGSVTIVKLVANLDGTFSSSQSFPFSSSSNFGMPGFSLVDNDPSQFGGGSITNANIRKFGPSNMITITELNVPGSTYSLADITCVERGGGFPSVNNSTVNLATGTASIIVDEQEFVTCTFLNSQLIPSAGNSSISGRVMSANGNGIRNATVVATDSDGTVHTALTSAFGYYAVPDLPTGRGYVVSVKSKLGAFTPRFVSLDDAVSGVDFIAGQ